MECPGGPGVPSPHSETSDSCEKYFSDISVIWITGPLLPFFFREGALERPDLEAAVLHLDCTALTTVAEGKSILGVRGGGWERDMMGCEGSLWLKLPWGLASGGQFLVVSPSPGVVLLCGAG